MVARLVWDQDAAGSNPVTSTTENLEKWLYKAKFQGFFLCLLYFFKRIKIHIFTLFYEKSIEKSIEKSRATFGRLTTKVV